MLWKITQTLLEMFFFVNATYRIGLNMTEVFEQIDFQMRFFWLNWELFGSYQWLSMWNILQLFHMISISLIYLEYLFVILPIVFKFKFSQSYMVYVKAGQTCKEYICKRNLINFEIFYICKFSAMQIISFTLQNCSHLMISFWSNCRQLSHNQSSRLLLWN